MECRYWLERNEFREKYVAKKEKFDASNDDKSTIRQLDPII